MIQFLTVINYGRGPAEQHNKISCIPSSLANQVSQGSNIIYRMLHNHPRNCGLSVMPLITRLSMIIE